MPAKKAAKKAAGPASAKKAAKKTAKKAAAPKGAARKTARSAKPPAPADTHLAAYLNYRKRLEKGEPGDALGDWLEAEKSRES